MSHVIEIYTIDDVPNVHQDLPVVESLNDLLPREFIYHVVYRGELDVLKESDIDLVYAIVQDGIHDIPIVHEADFSTVKKSPAYFHIEVVGNSIEMVVDHRVRMSIIETVTKYIHEFHRLLNTPEYIKESVMSMIDHYGGSLHEHIIYTDIDLDIETLPYRPYAGSYNTHRVDKIDNRLA